jgi:hypothetical protein
LLIQNASLPLNSIGCELAGDEILELAFGLLVAGPKAFVRVQHQQRDHVRVEAAG